MIPKTLNFVWFGPRALPDWWPILAKRWAALNPDYNIRIHEDLPLDSSLYEAFTRRCAYVESKSDVVRLQILKDHGGWYFDLDMVPLRPVDDILKDYPVGPEQCFVVRQKHDGDHDYDYANGILGCEKGAMAMRSLYADALLFQKLGVTSRCAYGPLLVTQAVMSRPAEFFVTGPPDMFLNPSDGLRAVQILQRLQRANFSEKAVRLEYPDRVPYMFHLWEGQLGMRPIRDRILREIAHGD